MQGLWLVEGQSGCNNNGEKMELLDKREKGRPLSLKHGNYYSLDLALLGQNWFSGSF